MKISLEQIVNTNYVKYSRLTELINYAYEGSNATNINIYIDMYSIIKPLYSNKEYEIMDYSALTACIINMCAHYREFFRTRYNVESKFFIVYSKNCNYVNNQFYPEYNHKNLYMFNFNKKVDDMINNNIELLTILSPYLPQIYFIPGTFETGVTIYDLICRNELIDSDAPHLIITKDTYNYQLIPTRPNVNILRPKKLNGEDYSYIITNNTLIPCYLNERKVQTKVGFNLSSGLISLIMALSSLPERNIKSLFNITSTLKMLTNAVADYKILNGYNSNTEYIWIGIYNSNFKIGYPTFEYRFKAIDIISQHNIFINVPESKNIELKDLYDPDTVRAINNRYFKNTPLDLNRL